MLRPGDDEVAGVEPEGEAAASPFAFALQLDRDERRVLDLDVELLDRRDQDEAAVGLAAQDGREQAHHRRPADRAALVKPGAVARDPHLAVAAMGRVPALDRRQPPLLGQPRDLGEAEAGEVVGGGGIGMAAPVAARLALCAKRAAIAAPL